MPPKPVAASIECPPVIRELVDRFREQIDAYCGPAYNETQVRREFIDPLFAALGWDVDNRAGHAEAYKDVIHEDAIKVGGATKAPDYCFRIGGVRKFFVEAKKPGRDAHALWRVLKDRPRSLSWVETVWRYEDFEGRPTDR